MFLSLFIRHNFLSLKKIQLVHVLSHLKKRVLKLQKDKG